VPLYEYTVLAADGQRRSGTIDAPNKDMALSRLRQEGYTPLVVELHKEPTNVEDIIARIRDIPLTVLVTFSRQFATMIASGMSPLNSLEVLAEQEENPKFKDAVTDVMVRVEAGEALYEALGAHPQVFPDLYTSMVRAGEESGNLAGSLAELATQLEKQQRLRRAVRSATMYPKVVSVVAFLIVSGLLMTIVPRFANLFIETVQSTQKPDAQGNLPDASLPAPTEFVVTISRALYPQGDAGSLLYWLNPNPAHFGVLPRVVLLLVAVFFVRKGIRRLMREPGPRAKWDGFKLRAPMRIGPLVQKLAVARFSRTFASLLRAGVPAQDAMEIVADTSGNALIADAVMQARDRMLAGSTIAEPLARSGVFPTMVTRMIEVGEETGQLEHMLVKVAEFFEDEVEMAIKSLTSIIEPLMIFIVAAAVGFIIIAIYLPMFKLYDLIGTGAVFAPFFAGKFSDIALHIRAFRAATQTHDVR